MWSSAPLNSLLSFLPALLSAATSIIFSSPLLSCWLVVLLHFVLPAAIFSQERDVHDNYFLKLNFRLLTSWASEMELISQTFAEWLLNRKMCLLLRHLMNWCAMSPELLQRSYHVSCINLFHFFFLVVVFLCCCCFFVCFFFSFHRVSLMPFWRNLNTFNSIVLYLHSTAKKLKQFYYVINKCVFLLLFTETLGLAATRPTKTNPTPSSTTTSEVWLMPLLLL